MVDYAEFVSLSQSRDSEERGMAAHLAAIAYLGHSGPADEHAALYAALFGFLDDQSVKVRAAMAYGLLHASDAPRPIMLALLHDSAVIARAVVQYSPVLIDADILPLLDGFDEGMVLAVAERATLGPRLVQALVGRGILPVTLRLLRRRDLSPGATLLRQVAAEFADMPVMRGALLARQDLPADARLHLVQVVTMALRSDRIVKGAIHPDRLDRLLRNAGDTAVTSIGEVAAGAGEPGYAENLAHGDRLNTRVMLHALINGHVLFFASCCAALSWTPPSKVFAILETGSRAALNALFVRCGISEPVRNVLARMIGHARAVDLADDVSARHFVVTVLTEELIAEHDGDIPEDLSDVFAYLSEQNVSLARRAAKGVMTAFAGYAEREIGVSSLGVEERLALPAA